jgi:hypothetical protein
MKLLDTVKDIMVDRELSKMMSKAQATIMAEPFRLSTPFELSRIRAEFWLRIIKKFSTERKQDSLKDSISG